MGQFRRLLGYLKPYRKRVALAVLLLLSQAFTPIVLPLIVRYTIDTALPHKDTRALALMFWAILALYAVRGIISFTLNYIIGWLGQRIVFDLRFQSYRHLHRLSLSYYDTRQTGKIMARLMGDIDFVQQMISGGFVTFIADLFSLVFVIGVLFTMQWRLALVSLAVVPFYVINYKLFIRNIRPLSEELREKWDAMLGVLQEKLAGINVVKAFVREDHETTQFMKTVQDNFTIAMLQMKLNRKLGAVAGTIRAFATGTILWYGGALILHRQMQIGELLAFNALLAQLYDPAVRIVDFNVSVQWTLSATERVFETLDTRPEIADTSDAVSLNNLRGEVDFQDVSFRYRAGGGDREERRRRAEAEAKKRQLAGNKKDDMPEQSGPSPVVLDDINLHVNAGEIIAIVGPSGAGKTTLVNLIARFYDVTGGRILIDGVDLRKVKLESVRRQIGIVSQESLLFSVTLKENIRYGAPWATDVQIIQAAKNADMHEFILNLPQGYDTKIGEDGIKLSVGQKQRMSIARATLTNPKILILDDATSALDSKTEANVQAALERLMQGRTSFVIAHRLSTIMNADRIVVMEHGHIVDVGTHDELVARPGVYQNLYNEQYKSARDQAMEALLA